MKHKTLKLMAVIVAAAVLCTLISLKNYSSSLNLVTTTSTINGAIRDNVTVGGLLKYNKTAVIELPSDCEVDEVFVCAGQDVSIGDAVVRLSLDKLELQKYQYMLSIEMLETAVTESSIQQNINRLKIKGLEGMLAQISKAIDNNGIIFSTMSGEIISQPLSTGNMTDRDSGIKIGLHDGGYFCEWEVSRIKNKKFTSITASLGNGVDLSCDSVQFQPARDSYLCRSKVFDIPESQIKAGFIEITLNYISDEYKATIPRSCIYADNYGSTYVYIVETRQRIYGTEFYVRKIGVTIKDQGDINAAILSEVKNVVVSSKRVPVEMEAVQVAD
jgi:hypothetical protein